MPKYETKLNYFLGRFYHDGNNDSLDKEVKRYVNENPGFLQVLQDKLKQVEDIPKERCVISSAHKKFLSHILEKINVQG